MSGDIKKPLLAIFVILTLITIFIGASNAADYDTETATSTATINVYVSISLTAALSGGVTFGSLEPNTNDNALTSCASMACNISISADTNTNVDIVMKTNSSGLEKGGGATIGNGNYTWNSSATIQPTVTGSHAIQNSMDYTNKIGSNVAASGKRVWQAWLDVPSAQSAGSYINLLSFCACETGQTDCT